MCAITADLVEKLHQPLPRYTSYPTAPQWKPISSLEYEKKIASLGHLPLSLYVHIPFCKTMCLFCGCSVILNRREDKEFAYVEDLCKEISLISRLFSHKPSIQQMHWGGGTPTKLHPSLIEKLFSKMQRHFELDFDGEIAIEIDPRTVDGDHGEKLHLLRSLGFNRVSFGVQDLNAEVQEAIRRRQSAEMTFRTYEKARELGFSGINLDLIYGLPKQTVESFQHTIEAIAALGPDRIALFSYAKVPWLKPHQNAIAEDLLPSTQEKFAMYASARNTLMEKGYVAIGMDHFAKPSDTLAKSYQEKKLHRNFQGYTVQQTPYLLGFGITAIGDLGDAFGQNAKTLEAYHSALENNHLPIERGLFLSAEDQKRKWVILSLMCRFSICKKEYENAFNESFDQHFVEEIEQLKLLQEDGLLLLDTHTISVTSQGELFIRSIAVVFDAYFSSKPLQYSQSI